MGPIFFLLCVIRSNTVLLFLFHGNKSKVSDSILRSATAARWEMSSRQRTSVLFNRGHVSFCSQLSGKKKLNRPGDGGEIGLRDGKDLFDSTWYDFLFWLLLPSLLLRTGIVNQQNRRSERKNERTETAVQAAATAAVCCGVCFALAARTERKEGGRGDSFDEL